MRRFLFIQPLSGKGWHKKHKVIPFAPGFINRVAALLTPAFKLGEANINQKNEQVQLTVWGVVVDGNAGNLVNTIDKLQPNCMVFSRENYFSFKDLEVLSDIPRCTGEVAMAALVYEGLNKYFRQQTIDNPKVFIWGADSFAGKDLVRLCAKQWKKITIAGYDQGALQRLVNMVLYETGTTLKIGTLKNFGKGDFDLRVCCSKLPKDFKTSIKVVCPQLRGPVDRKEGINNGFSLLGSRKLKWNFALAEALCLSSVGLFERLDLSRLTLKELLFLGQCFSDFNFYLEPIKDEGIISVLP